jgi:hypothetical protein
MLGFGGDYTPGAYNFNIQDGLAGAVCGPSLKGWLGSFSRDATGGATLFTVTSPTLILHLAFSG